MGVPGGPDAVQAGRHLGPNEAGRPSASGQSGKICAVGTIERVLVGSRGTHPEARVSIADGSPGGAEIRLIAIDGGRRIVAEILTATAGSRETLTNAMEEIRVRLRRRGIELSMTQPESTQPERQR